MPEFGLKKIKIDYFFWLTLCKSAKRLCGLFGVKEFFINNNCPGNQHLSALESICTFMPALVFELVRSKVVVLVPVQFAARPDKPLGPVAPVGPMGPVAPPGLPDGPVTPLAPLGPIGPVGPVAPSTLPKKKFVDIIIYSG